MLESNLNITDEYQARISQKMVLSLSIQKSELNLIIISVLNMQLCNFQYIQEKKLISVKFCASVSVEFLL